MAANQNGGNVPNGLNGQFQNGQNGQNGYRKPFSQEEFHEIGEQMVRTAREDTYRRTPQLRNREGPNFEAAANEARRPDMNTPYLWEQALRRVRLYLEAHFEYVEYLENEAAEAAEAAGVQQEIDANNPWHQDPNNRRTG